MSVVYISTASGTEKKVGGGKNEKMLVGGRKNAACGGILYTYICIQKIYIIRFTNRNGCCVICRAWRKCVESLTRIRRRRLLIIFVYRGAYTYMYSTACA